jgi:hypothetical protein
MEVARADGQQGVQDVTEMEHRACRDQASQHRGRGDAWMPGSVTVA